MSILPDVQLIERPGVIDFGWGHPDPALLPTAELARAAAFALSHHGSAALAYGAAQGPGRLLDHICQRFGRLEGISPPLDQLMITGGISQALDMLCAQLSRPGDLVLVEAPTYHLALRIFRDRGLRIVAVPGDSQGMHVEAAASMLQLLRARGERVAFLYLVASFGNPSGATLAPERRAALAALACRAELFVLEDDAYGELWYDAPPPSSIWSVAADGPLVRLGSYAKILAPGLRLGWLLAPRELVQRCVGSGLLDSGGGVNHFTAQVVAACYELGILDAHIELLRASFRLRRDALLAALARYMPSGCTWHPALGGFFVWVRLSPGIDSAALLPLAEQAGVAFLPGERFFAEGGGKAFLRLSFSMLSPKQLDLGVQRLGALLRRA